jgi:hypothetical protein
MDDFTALEIPVSRFRAILEQLRPCLGSQECLQLDRLGNVLGHLPNVVQDEVLASAERAERVLIPLAGIVQQNPIGEYGEHLGGRERNPDSLIDNLCSDTGLPVECLMPTSAIVGRALVFARRNFLKSIVYALEAADSVDPNLILSFKDRVDDGTLSLLAHELLSAAVANSRNQTALRRAAAARLVSMWQNCLKDAVRDFPDILLQAWRARQCVQEVFGTLIGVHELLTLFNLPGSSVNDREIRRFVAFFEQKGDDSSDHTQAFREFLFGLPFEELQMIELAVANKDGKPVSRKEVSKIIGRELPPIGIERPSAEQVYQSYRRRRTRAEYRSLHELPGPKKTAEGYIIEFLLLSPGR